jgi:hypothetical protein
MGHLLFGGCSPVLRAIVLVKLPNGTDPGGKFIIVQSHARIPLQQVRDYCLSFAG